MNYSNVNNCKYVTEDKLHIGCQVTFDKLGNVYFVASANDSEPHGREIYQRARSGEFGPVADYIPIREELTEEQKINQARNIRNQLLIQLDTLISNPLRWASLSNQEKTEISNYRLALLDLPQQDGFPNNIIWPEKPAFIVNNTTSIVSQFIL